jgi:N-acetylmuramoyl-L-alanine amidase
MRHFHAVSSLSAALLLAGAGIAQAAQTADVQGITVVESGGRTRALIEVPDGTDYSVFALSNPNRLVLDLHNSHFGTHFHAPGPDGLVANVRTGQPVAGDARVVFDLSSSVHPRSYFQNQNGRSQLVIELLTAAETAKPNSAKPDPVVAVLTKVPSGIAADTAASDSDDSSDAMPALPSVAVKAPASKRPSVAELRKLNPRVDPPVSSVVITPGSAPGLPASVAATTDAAPPRYRPGARTMRDVLGVGQRKLVIAIDAGHGGQDVGARGYSGSYEKNVTLATARELARQVNAEPGMQAVLTRDGDYFVPLADRYRKARAAKADLFISIHADADPTHSATGSSVWVLSQRGVTSQAARWLADRENAADLIGGVSLSDKDGTLASVLLDLSQSATMKASDDAAERVHQALRDIGRTHKSHPEHANFVVLRSPDVPSMLVETAFITNADEEQHLNDSDYRSRLANAVLTGVRSYFIDNPLPDTQFAALHDPNARRNARMIAAESNDARAVASAPSRAVDADNDRAPMQLASADDAQQIHIVQRGERLIDIANQYGVSLMQLRSYNDLEGSRVRTGQRLRIPPRSGAG